jgi:hypothetical protein
MGFYYIGRKKGNNWFFAGRLRSRYPENESD